MDDLYKIKIALLGEGEVGKTYFIRVSRRDIEKTFGHTDPIKSAPFKS